MKGRALAAEEWGAGVEGAKVETHFSALKFGCEGAE